MSLYAADGSINVTVVDGMSFTGLYAADGSWNVFISDGVHYGMYHPCGALIVTVASAGPSGYYAPNGSIYVEESPYTYSGALKVTSVSGSLNGIVLSATSIPENSANGTTLATASISTSYTGTPSWSITDASGTFQIDNTTGIITVLSNTALNYEVNTSLPITVSVTGTTPTFPNYNRSISITNVIETPVNTVAPAISGTAAFGQILAVSNGTWTDMTAGSYTYQWKRGGVNISGATSVTYSLVTADVGTVITCTVTATNTTGNANVTTSGTSNVTASPVNTVLPSISGSTSVGSTLTAANGTWTGYPTSTYTYQWKSAGVAISGATSSTYVIQAGDVGNTLTVSVTGTNTSGSASATSAATATVTAGATIVLSANQDIQGSAQGTTIGTLSVTGGTGTYTFTLTDATNQTQLNVDGVTLEVGSAAPGVGSASITIDATNGSGSTPSGSFTINTVPQAPTLDLAASSDLGSSATDNITSDNTPEIDLTFPTTLVAGDVVKLYDGATLIKTYTITSTDVTNGTAALGLSALSDGSHSLTATHARGSLVSAASSALSVTIDTVAPVLSSASGVQNGTTDTQADLSVTTDTGEGTIYWIATTNATTPTADQIKLGNDASGSAAAGSGMIAVSSTGVKTSSVSGLATNTYSAFWVQTDVAGNTSSVATASWSQTVSSFSPNAVLFNSSAALVNSAPTGTTNGKQGVISLWYLPPSGADGTLRYIASGTHSGSRWWLLNQTNNRILLRMRDASSTDRLQIQTNKVDFTNANGWRHLAFSWDTGAAIGQVYSDGASDLYATHTIDGTAALDYTGDIRINEDMTGTIQAGESLCEFYLNFNETLNLATGITSFRNVDGTLPSLGTNGSLPTGNQPTVYLGGSHDNTNWQTNLGSCGNFTVTGSLSSTTAP